MNDEIQKNLIDELGLSDLPEDKKDELLMKMTEAVLQRIFLETMEKLTDRDQDEYTKMIEGNGAPEELEKFLQERISDYEVLVSKIVTDFVEEMKATKE